MKLLQDLLALKPIVAPALVEHDSTTDDVSDLIDKYIDQEKMYHFEGSRGYRNFEQLVKVLNPDYTDLQTFLMDNPGCYEAMIEWLKEQRSSDWASELKANLHDDEGDDE